MDRKNYPISHPRKSIRPGNITSGLFRNHTAFIPQYWYAEQEKLTALSFLEGLIQAKPPLKPFC